MDQQVEDVTPISAFRRSGVGRRFWLFRLAHREMQKKILYLVRNVEFRRTELKEVATEIR